MSRRRNVDVLPFELLPVPHTAPAPRPLTDSSAPLTLQTFPVCTRPAVDEALLSWLLRLATQLGVSLTTLAQSCFGVDDCSAHSLWWYRPGPSVLKRISQCTGVRIADLRRLTLEKHSPCYRDDEANERFCGGRYQNDPPRWRAFRFVVCGQCLSADAEPYLRASWLLGWLAVCPTHNTLMIPRCDNCRSKCRIARSSSVTAFSPTICTRCGDKLSIDIRPASSSVVRLQASLLQAKHDGVAEFEGIGVFTWPEIVALFDVLQGTFWTARTVDEQQRDFDRYAVAAIDEWPEARNVYDGRYGTLRFLAWLTEGWPHSTGSTLGQRLLERWLTRPRSRISQHLKRGGDVWCYGADDFGPAIRDRLRRLVTGCREA